MTNSNSGRTPNRLSEESSPYLLQHQYNPVDWYPWGEEAFERARAENKPLLISIGYSACHWCHVMEHESFSDPEIVRQINETVIPVKVDREERPDVDAIYMEACQAMTGHGGWPLNAFVTPELKPFFVGTYFPPQDNYGRPGFSEILTRIREAWITEGAGIARQAETLHKELTRHGSAVSAQSLAGDLLETIVQDSSSMYDLRHGGFGTAPKFPPDTRLAALLAAFHSTKSQAALDMTTRTLEAMAYGGMYDQVGGGFARYSVDAQWLIPHFEKMLYNQALLIPVYADAWLLTGRPLFKRIAFETADWVLRELTADDGAFQCAYDADSEGEEGKFYVWTPKQISEILPGTDADLFCKYYGITERGNFEHGTSNPHVKIPPEEFAKQNNLDPDDWQARLGNMRDTVRAAREKRVWPGLDDKCLVSWNGLMISALTRLAQVFDEAKYLDAAKRAATRLVTKQWDGETLLRVLKDDRSSVRGTLDDYAFLADALVDLYETTLDAQWLDHARAIARRMAELFRDGESGIYYFTDGTDPNLITRTKDTHDGALPASASIAIKAMLRLGHMDRDESLLADARKSLAADGTRANAHPMAFSSLVLANLYAQPDIPEITVTGKDREDVDALLRAAYGIYLPARIICGNLESGTATPPIATDKPVSAPATAYVCRDFTCSAPVSDTTGLTGLLSPEVI